MPLNKKDVELHYFQRFKVLLEPFPSGSILPTEEPDFLVIGTARIIGIELTELHREELPDRNPLQATESMRRRVVTRAQEIYVEFGLPPVLCKIFMHDSHIQKNEVEPLAKAIVGIAQRNFPSPSSSTEETYEWVNRHYFPEIINSISMYHLDTMTQAKFICSGVSAHLTASITPDGKSRR